MFSLVIFVFQPVFWALYYRKQPCTFSLDKPGFISTDFYHCVVWSGLTIAAIIDWNDPVVVHGLQHRVKYVRIVRRKLKGGVRFYVQLVCEGKQYRKPKNYTGEGYVGLYIGPSTIAIVSENGAALKQFCFELEDNSRKIRRLQRKLDRQRRANNPDNYNENNTIKAGKKTWRPAKSTGSRTV